jgi:hypothetical protein
MSRRSRLITSIQRRYFKVNKILFINIFIIRSYIYYVFSIPFIFFSIFPKSINNITVLIGLIILRFFKLKSIA